ncbi:MAG: HEPN domain-containing protein [Bacteroidota bacterium]|nr:HEPN domain-containing protein [Bacteroidota bacterium]
MTKQEHIKYWIDSSEEDWKVVWTLFESENFVYSLFFAHLVLEKLTKAIWVNSNEGNIPPKVHNLVYILEKANFKIPDSKKDFLILMNNFQIEGRYPDYRQKVYKLYEKNNTQSILNQVKEYREWLLNLAR